MPNARPLPILAVSLSLGLALAAQPAPLEWEPFEGRDPEGNPVQLERATLLVPENRSKAHSRPIELAVVRLRSSAGEPGPPVLYLAGGPGGSAIASGRFPHLSRLYRALNEKHDIVLMDQRGAGRSRPRLLWPAPSSLPPDFLSSREKMIEYVRRAHRQAAQSMREQGVDLAGYTTVESAADIDALRRALGAEKVSLLGFSYGTHLALATIRSFGPHLDRVVLVGTEGPHHNDKLPATYDAQLYKLSRLAAASPGVGGKVPDLAALLRRVLDQLDADPAVVTITDRRAGENIEVPVGRFGLQLLLRLDVGDGNDFPEFPLLLHRIEQGDYGLLAKYVQKRHSQFSQGVNVMGTVMDLASGATEHRRRRIAGQLADSLLGEAVNLTSPYVADIWGNPDLGYAYRSPIHSDVTTLFVSGTLDSNTPPAQAEEVRWGFSDSHHLIVEYAGHEDMLPHSEVQENIVRFLGGGEVTAARISLGRPEFVAVP